MKANINGITYPIKPTIPVTSSENDVGVLSIKIS